MELVKKKRTVTISFKNNPEDDELFKICDGLSDKSCYIKDVLREHFKDRLAKKDNKKHSESSKGFVDF